MDSLNNVCRLCSETGTLKWVFDKKLDCVEKVDLVNVISTITGVEILAEDTISQNICTECYQISIGIDQFRMRARKNNEFLMDRYNEMLKTSSVVHEIRNNDAKKKVEQGMITEATNDPNYTIHQSVKDLLKLFPRLNLPSACLNSNIDPSIVLNEGAVKNFLKKDAKNRHLSVRLLKPSNRNDKKRISTASVSIPVSPLPINFEKISENTAKPKKRRHDCAFPKKKPIGEFAEELCLVKSVPLFICNICDAVHNNSRELRMHRVKHLRCQFCRSTFKTMDSKVAHLKSMCAIKNMMVNLPSVELGKIELDPTIRTKYPKAFVGHSLISTEETPGYEVSRDDKKTVGCNVGCYDDDDDVSDIFADTGLQPENELINGKGVVAVRNIKQSGIRSSLLPMKSQVAEEVFSTIPPVTSTPSLVTQPDIIIENSDVSDKLDTRLSDTQSIDNDFLSKPAVMKKISLVSRSLSVFTTPVVSATPSLTPISPAVLSTTPSIVSSSRSTVTESANCPRPQKPGRLCGWNDLNPIDANEVNKCSSNESSFQDRNPEISPAVMSKNLPSSSKTTIHPSNNPVFALPMCSMIRFSTPANSLTELSTVHRHVVSSNLNKGPGSGKRYILVRKVSKQQSNTVATPNTQLYPNSANITYGLSDRTSVNPSVATMAGLQTPETNPVVSTVNNCPNATHSAIYNLQKSLAVQNKIPCAVPNRGSIAATSGRVFGRIRVRSLRELM